MARSAVAAMDQIEQFSREITSIIGVIDDIARRTCLRSMLASKPLGRAKQARGLLSLPRKYVSSPSVRRRPPRRSRT